MKKTTLLCLFQQKENELKNQLSGLFFPRDSVKLNAILADLFVEHVNVEDYKQELTNTELAIFHSSLQLVNESMKMQQNILSFVKGTQDITRDQSIHSKTSTRLSSSRKSQIAVVGAAATGVLAGSVTNFGTILLAVVVTAVGVYVSNEERRKNAPQGNSVCNEYAVNADAIIDTTKKICQNVDNLMNVYQTNIENIKARMDSMPVVTLHGAYGYLLNRLSILYRDKTNNASASELEDDFAKLFKTLKNYNYEFVNYSEDVKDLFDVEELEEISEPEVAEVAVLEKGECIVRGKYYKPKK